jgi:lipid-binding SYLF domain-containing protein
MHSRTIGIVLLAVSVLIAAGCRTPKGESVQEKRNYALQMRNDALSELYAKQPQAKAHVSKAPGYAVFSNVGSKILMLATGSGFGVATDNRSGKNTYMRMVEAGGGMGMGVKTYRAVYVFNSREAFDDFLSGSWQVGGDADAGAEYEGKGMSAGAALNTDQLTKPVTVYQFTDKGVSLSAVATGTRFYKDDELN